MLDWPESRISCTDNMITFTLSMFRRGKTIPFRHAEWVILRWTANKSCRALWSREMLHQGKRTCGNIWVGFLAQITKHCSHGEQAFLKERPQKLSVFINAPHWGISCGDGSPSFKEWCAGKNALFSWVREWINASVCCKECRTHSCCRLSFGCRPFARLFEQAL